MIRTTENHDQSKYITYGQMNLINDFRSLWTEIVIWLRSYIVSTISGFGDINAINNKLYSIPEDFKQRLEPYLGVGLAEQFQQLLLMYIVNAQSVINAMYNQDQAATDSAVIALYKTTDDMSDLLASVNPYWNKVQWQYLLYNLVDMGIVETRQLLTGEFASEIDIRGRMLKHALVLGDYMASGVMYLLPGDA
jgi:hypothetical protein